MKNFGLVLLAVFCFSNFAQATMPEYEDDAEFKHCMRFASDIDDCVKEETRRVLNNVKEDYRKILGDVQLMSWNGSQQANAAMLRDMYSAWTAYRNRLCSLSEASSKYLEPLITEKYSCTLYHTFHHRAHLDSIVELMNYRGKERNDKFSLFKVYEHDNEYTHCREQAKKAKNECLNVELERKTKRVKDMYNTLLHDDFVGKWNNAPDLRSGNYRDMFDSWIAYRNRLCSLSAWAYANAKIQPKVGQAECILFLTNEHLEVLGNLLFAANSSLDSGFEDEHEENEVDENEEWSDDGGLAEGQTITPLQNKIETKTYLTGEDNASQPAKNDTPKSGPAWAN